MSNQIPKGFDLELFRFRCEICDQPIDDIETAVNVAVRSPNSKQPDQLMVAAGPFHAECAREKGEQWITDNLSRLRW